VDDTTTVGEEDVLAEPVLDGPADPHRFSMPRTRFRRPRDLVAVALIIVVALVAWLVLWQHSDEHATTSQTAAVAIAPPPPPDVFPPSLAEVWRAGSPATTQPVVTGTAIVTGSGGELLGRNPLTGTVAWRYARDLPLCTVSTAWSRVLAVYKTDGRMLPATDPRSAGGCSEVSLLHADDGERDTARNDDAQLGTHLIYDGNYVTATGPDVLDTWRSDLVLTVEYGKMPDLRNAGKQRVNPEEDTTTSESPNTCKYGSVAAGGGFIAVIERCSDDLDNDRLSVYKAVGKDDWDQPEVTGSVEVGTHDAQIIALSGDHIAVALPDPQRIVVYTIEGKKVSEYPLHLPDGDLRVGAKSPVVSTATGPGMVYWYTGSRTIALNQRDFSPQWTVEGALGAGTRFAGKLLMPVPGGIDVLDPVTGKKIGTFPVDRGDYTGPVEMDFEGPVVFEQRGATLVALR
jgi:hypothetical protein